MFLLDFDSFIESLSCNATDLDDKVVTICKDADIERGNRWSLYNASGWLWG